MDKKLLKKLQNINKDDSFLITFTVFNKKKKLDTFLFVNDFPYKDIPSTKKMISKLIDEMVEKKN